MKAALLPERGVVKVAGEDARRFLNGLATNDIGKPAPGQACFAALLTPQGKIIVDFIVVEATPEDGGGFFLDCPRALAPALVEKLNFYKLRAKVAIEDLSQALGVPRGGTDFIYGDTFPHEADMDQLAGVDFDKGCYVGQEVVSRVEHRAKARSRVVPIAYDEYSPMPGIPVMAGDKQVGTLGSTAKGRGLALLRLDRVADALSAGTPLTAGGIAIRVVKPDWARFPFPGETQAAS